MNVIFTLKNGEHVLLRADKFNYELCQSRLRTDKSSGETIEEWEPMKWFGSLEQALNRVLDLKVRTADARTLEELKREVMEARSEVNALWSTSIRASQ